MLDNKKTKSDFFIHVYTPISGVRYFLYIFVLNLCILGLGFGFMYSSYGLELMDIIKDPIAMETEMSFRVAAGLFMPLSFLIDVRRVNSFLNNMKNSFLVVTLLFTITTPFSLFGFKDPYYISSIVSIIFVICLIFFNAQNEEITSI